MAPKYNVATCVEELRSTTSYWRSKRLSKRAKVPQTPPGPGSQIGAVGRCEEEGKAIHSFNICPKAPHGSQIQCCNMCRRIDWEAPNHTGGANVFQRGSKCHKPGPGSQIRAVGRCKVEGKAIHSFNICPKAPHGSQIQCCNMRRRIGKRQIILEEQTSFEEGRSAKPVPCSQIGALSKKVECLVIP